MLTSNGNAKARYKHLRLKCCTVGDFGTESFSVQQCGEVNKLKEENSDIAKEMVETVF